jgi:serine/threonine protein kinase
MPLSVQRGQAEVFILKAEDGTTWILKRFHPGRTLDRRYLLSVQSLVPRADGFASGMDRRLLQPGDLQREPNCYYAGALTQWLDGTILMPRIPGVDWSSLADEIREGQAKLGRMERLLLCRNLAGLVAQLEQTGGAHRDISSGNVFILPGAWQVSLIDFDSLFHPSLAMPVTTTCGTMGYVAPFTWRNGAPDPQASWCPFADRYALSILCAEFLILDKGSPLTADGGMFDQEELKWRSGMGLANALARLNTEFPGAAPLFQQALQSSRFNQCPSPEDWHQFCVSTGRAAIAPPRLDDMEQVGDDFFQQILAKRCPPPPVWPAPSLSDLPDADLEQTEFGVEVVAMPPSPWKM